MNAVSKIPREFLPFWAENSGDLLFKVCKTIFMTLSSISFIISSHTAKNLPNPYGFGRFWSRIRESNPPSRLGKPLYYRYTNPACGGIIANPLGEFKHFLTEADLSAELHPAKETYYSNVPIPAGQNRANSKWTFVLKWFQFHPQT